MGSAGQQATTPAGFFGKLPARGDFVERRLDRGFSRALGDWLEASLAASKAQLGDAWLGLYLEAPLWRFALGAGVARPVVGVMMPSVDRVGRYFPLVIAAHVPDGSAEPAGEWFDAAEQCILLALEDDCTFELFDAEVAALASPPAQVPSAAGACVWWTGGSERVAACALTGSGFPPPSGFSALLDGEFRKWQWREASGPGFGDLPTFTMMGTGAGM